MEYVKDNGTLEAIAEEQIRGTEIEDVRICYQRGLKTKKSGGRTVYADCRKVPEWLHEFVPIDYVITVYEPADSLTDDGLRVLMYHELLHIQVEDGKTKIRPHDLQDFREITDVYGVDWVESFGRQTRMDLGGGDKDA